MPEAITRKRGTYERRKPRVVKAPKGHPGWRVHTTPQRIHDLPDILLETAGWRKEVRYDA